MQHISIAAPNQHRFGVYLRGEADQSVVNEIFKFREYRAAEEIINGAQDPIIDVGAHAGFFTLYVRALNKNVPIFALEPEIQNRISLERHLVENDVSGVTILPYALAGRFEKRFLVTTVDSHTHYLAARGIREGVPVLTYDLVKLFEVYHIKQAALVKMDIEGGEYDVFSHAQSNELSRLGAIIMEFHQYDGHEVSEIEDTLRESGFSVQIFPSQFDPRMGFLLAKNKRYGK